jgi:pyruvate dehydrogenase E2 component (dihydrolipoamide acetyltransferase)
MYDFKLPDLGEGIHEGEIVKWHVNPGDTIKEDDPLLDIETDKATATIPSPKGGKIVSTNGNTGDIVEVGTVLASIDDGSGIQAKVPEIKKSEPVTEKPAGAPAEKPTPQATGEEKCTIPAAPATRRLAREMGINICTVTPTGPGGRVTPEDIRSFSEKQTQATPATEAPKEVQPKVAEAEFAAHAASVIPYLDIEPMPDFTQWGPVVREPLISIRRRVAHKMETSKVLIPHVVHYDEADVTLLDAFRVQERERLKDHPGSELNLLPFVIKAVVAGLKASPSFNASVDFINEEIIYKKYYNIGIAVDTDKGLMVPVVKDAGSKSILKLSAEIHDLAKRARDGSIAVEELRGSTFTITNIGPLGGTILLPAINYPESAILGMGRATDKPVVRDGQIVIRKMLPLTLAFDHRIADGADAARFVTEMVKELSDPNLLLLET